MLGLKVEIEFNGKRMQMKSKNVTVKKILEKVRHQCPGADLEHYVLKCQHTEVRNEEDLLSVADEKDGKQAILIEVIELQTGSEKEEKFEWKEQKSIRYSTQSDELLERISQVSEIFFPKKEKNSNTEASDEESRIDEAEREKQKLISTIKQGQKEEGSGICRLIDERINKKLKNMKIRFPKKQKAKNMTIKDIKINVQNSLQNPKIVKTEEKIEWKFIVEVQGTSGNIYHAYILDLQSQKTKPIQLFEGIQEIIVGPFQAEEAGKLKKRFSLWYYNDKSEIEVIGKEFNFEVDVQEANRQLMNKFRICIDRKKRKQRKDIKVEDIMRTLKEFGINQHNYIEHEQLMNDIFGQL